MTANKSQELKKQKVLEQLARSLPGIPEPVLKAGDQVEVPDGTQLGRIDRVKAPVEKTDWNGDIPVPGGHVNLASMEEPFPGKILHDPCALILTPRKKLRKPRAPRAEKPPRKKAQGTYAVLTEGKVANNKIGIEGKHDTEILTVFVPSDLGTFRSRKAADEGALQMAREKPGVVVVVVRLLGRMSVQEVKTVKLVRG